MSHLVRRSSTHTHNAIHRYVYVKIFATTLEFSGEPIFFSPPIFRDVDWTWAIFTLLVFSFWRLNSPVAWIIFPFITSALHNGISIDSVKTWRNGKQHKMVFYVNLIVRIRRKYTHESYKTNLVLCIWMPQPRSQSLCLAKMSSEITSEFFFASPTLHHWCSVGCRLWVCHVSLLFPFSAHVLSLFCCLSSSFCIWIIRLPTVSLGMVQFPTKYSIERTQLK